MPPGQVTVVIPAFNEERLIQETLARVPAWVADICVVDDASPDETARRAEEFGDPRVRVLRHRTNHGVGAAIATGYRAALARAADFVVVMAGDNQMDPADLPALLAPLQQGKADYAKGNRLLHERAQDMPRLRRWGTGFLARLTNWAGGIRLGDTQCGYTAIRSPTLRALDLEGMWPRYGYPNDLLLQLAGGKHRIVERAVRPVYGSEKSGLRFWHLATIVYVIGRRWWLLQKSGQSVSSEP